MKTINPYSGTDLENTYSPVVFSLDTISPVSQNETDSLNSINSAIKTAAIKAVAENTLPHSLPESLDAALTMGLAIPYRLGEYDDEEETTFQATITLEEIYSVWGILEKIMGVKDLEKMKKKYELFGKQARKDFKRYREQHESYLKDMDDAVTHINMRKGIMKGYLLQELYDQLRRSGLNVTIEEPTLERLDLRKFPINEGYNLSLDKNKDFKDNYRNLLLILPKGFWLFAAANWYLVRKIRNKLEQLQIVAKLNYEQMHSDLIKLKLLMDALINIDKIYKEVVERLKPIMKDILKKLEYMYNGDVNRMPKNQADALYTIKTLLKEMAEYSIMPPSNSSQDFYTNVCKSSNNISDRYNQVRDNLYNSFLK